MKRKFVLGGLGVLFLMVACGVLGWFAGHTLQSQKISALEKEQVKKDTACSADVAKLEAKERELLEARKAFVQVAVLKSALVDSQEELASTKDVLVATRRLSDQHRVAVVDLQKKLAAAHVQLEALVASDAVVTELARRQMSMVVALQREVASWRERAEKCKPQKKVRPAVRFSKKPEPQCEHE